MIPTPCPADIDYATRAIALLPRETWDHAAEHIVRSATLAAELCRLLKRSHPALGNGTFAVALQGWPMAVPNSLDSLTQAEVMAALSRAVIRVCNSDSVEASDRR